MNATGSSQLRTVEHVWLRWKNLKQKATRDYVENPKTGYKPLKGILHGSVEESIDKSQLLKVSSNGDLLWWCAP